MAPALRKSRAGPRPPQVDVRRAGLVASIVRALHHRLPGLVGAARRTVYRTPLLRNVMLPTYPYWVDPGVLTAMLGLIDATRNTGAAVVEIGVGRGDSSVFILEHLLTTADPRNLVLVDTFDGFTRESIAYETSERRKRGSEISDYSYLDSRVFEHGLVRLGYSNYRIVAGDCTEVRWAEVVGPVGAVLLDVDLYLPSRRTLDAIWPLVVPGGGIVVDDCIEPNWADGALQAYTEFTKLHGLPFTRVGGKGGLMIKPHTPEPPLDPGRSAPEVRL